jgi:hypothetical protein
MPDDLGVVPLAAPPPSVVVLDTSAVVCALLGDQPQHEEYAGFLARAISAGTTFVYCDLLDFELADVSMTIALKRRHGRAWFRHRTEEASVADARDLMREVFAQWRETLAQTSSARLPLGPIPERGEGCLRFPKQSPARQGRRSAPMSGISGLPRTPPRGAMQPGNAAQFAARDTSARGARRA